MLESLKLLYVENKAITAIFVLTVSFRTQDGEWMGECLELGTTAVADTLEEVRQRLNEAISLQINEMDRVGCAREILADRGVHPLPIAESLLTATNYVTAGAPA